MRIALIGVAASAALVSATAIALAQVPGAGSEPPGKMQGPSNQGPSSQGPGTQGPGSQGPSMKQPGGKAESGPPAQRAPDSGKATRESQGLPGSKGAQGPGEAPSKGKDQPKASEGPAEKSAPKSTQTQPEKGQPKATQTQPEKSQPKATQTQPEKGQKSSQGTQQSGRVQVSEQERTGVREHLLRDGKLQKTRLDIRVSVGTRVPRSVRLLPLPVAIIDLAPGYRGYSYIVLEDERICVVDPRTYDVVDVIEVGSQRAERPQQRAALSLSQEQMRFISANVPREPRSDVRVRLALGAEVPRDVELLAFPREVTSRIPELQGYSYVVAENDIAIVDRNERGVVLVITE